jgi:hypothetical protein
VIVCKRDGITWEKLYRPTVAKKILKRSNTHTRCYNTESYFCDESSAIDYEFG